MRPLTTMILGMAALLPAASALAGASNAVLSCRSTDKTALKLEGNIPGDFAEFDLKLFGKGEIVMTDAADKIHVVAVFDQKVFTLVVARKDGRDLVLYALPSSVTSTPGSSRHPR